jgi:hypothetical protein
MHLTDRTTGPLATPAGTARWAALWFVEKTLLSKEGLLASREDEVYAAFTALERPVREVHPGFPPWG